MKERNAESIAGRAAATWDEAIKLAKDSDHESKSYEDAYRRGVAASRSVFWPCSAVIAICGVEREEVPASPRPKQEGGGEGEGGGGEPPAEEGEDGEPEPPPMKQVEVPVLRYVATSHPDKRAIEGWTLRYLEAGKTGSVIETGEPLLVHSARSADQGLHFFNGRARGASGGGSYCAVALKDAEDGSVYGCLCLDTLFDDRPLTDADVQKLKDIAACIDQAREPFAAVDREKRRKQEEEEKSARAAAEAEAQRIAKEEAAAAAEAEAAEGGEERGEDKGN